MTQRGIAGCCSWQRTGRCHIERSDDGDECRPKSCLDAMTNSVSRTWAKISSKLGRRGRRRLYVDVSLIARHDAGTGIQRTVKGIWQALRDDAASDFDLVPVIGLRLGGYRRTRDDFLARPVSKRLLPHPGNRITVRPGDAFLGLDFTPHVIVRSERQLAGWRKSGARLAFVAYDVLPVQRPEWFTPLAAGRFRSWLDAVARLADEFLCISSAVQDDLRMQMAVRRTGNDVPPVYRTITLGGVIAAGPPGCTGPAPALPEDVTARLAWVRGAKTVLVVGTVEPRKGHDLALAALTELWSRSTGPRPRLLLVGRPGWGTKQLQADIRTHPALGRDLVWDSDASDALLKLYYEACHGVLVPSRGEGFGLPLLEALCHGKPVLARNLPVFREFASPEVVYFDTDDPTLLADEIAGWLIAGQPTTPLSQGQDWSNAAAQVRSALGM
jgi:glycosyltransferase involved in cell wall biosynthesis